MKSTRNENSIAIQKHVPLEKLQFSEFQESSTPLLFNPAVLGTTLVLYFFFFLTEIINSI